MKFYHKPFNHDLYKEYDQPGKSKVFKVIETSEDPKSDLKSDNFWNGKITIICQQKQNN